jgi:hypothetical protein
MNLYGASCGIYILRREWSTIDFYLLFIKLEGRHGRCVEFIMKGLYLRIGNEC